MALLLMCPVYINAQQHLKIKQKMYYKGKCTRCAYSLPLIVSGGPCLLKLEDRKMLITGLNHFLNEWDLAQQF